MSRLSRSLTLLASLLLLATFALPVWNIRLTAPQYPEGLGMRIRLSTIEGAKENDLRNINSLNHYIGMKPIEPSAIPELQYIPWIVGALVAGGLAAAALGRRRVLAVWIVSIAVAGTAGLYDFWRWSYNYGHNLDLENAIIVVPGMTYQPPLFGTKQLLNFTATSLPAAGGIAAALAFALGCAALFVAYRGGARRVSAASALVLATSCAGVPQAIHVGADHCAECAMLVADARFGAQVVSQTGRLYTFDSADCLTTFLARQPHDFARQVRVVDANAPGTLIDSADARFTIDTARRPPMGSMITVRRDAR